MLEDCETVNADERGDGCGNGAGTALVHRATIEEVVRYRNRALELYAEAYEAIGAADKAVKAAHEMAQRASPGINGYNYSQADEIKAFANAVRLPDRERYLRTARRLLDINIWAWIIERTDLERLMDYEAKKTLRDQMAYVPERTDRQGALINADEIEKGLPQITVENIMATLERFRLDAGMIFRRGLANAFSQLDRRFRSHDGFKIGSRVILTRVFNEYGSLEYGRTRDVLIDIERVFAVLDGEAEATFRSALGALEYDRRGFGGPRQSEVETEYFKIRGYKNGNAHLWFLRDDLVEKVNKVLAEHYGEVLGDGQTQEEEPLDNVKTTPAKRYGFFPTPDSAADQVVRGLPLLARRDEPRLRILEPSAGTGNLARRCVKTIGTLDDWSGGRARWKNEYRFDNQVDCVEIQPALAQALDAEGIYRKVYNLDFLALSPEVTGLYDYVVMNPPFDRERDIDHVMHALKFLEPSGTLVAVMSAGTEFRGTKKSTAFRALMKSMRARFQDLPPGSFAEVGTYCNTMILTVRKDCHEPGHLAGRARFE